MVVVSTHASGLDSIWFSYMHVSAVIEASIEGLQTLARQGMELWLSSSLMQSLMQFNYASCPPCIYMEYRRYRTKEARIWWVDTLIAKKIYYQ